MKHISSEVERGREQNRNRSAKLDVVYFCLHSFHFKHSFQSMAACIEIGLHDDWYAADMYHRKRIE